MTAGAGLRMTRMRVRAGGSKFCGSVRADENFVGPGLRVTRMRVRVCGSPACGSGRVNILRIPAGGSKFLRVRTGG